MQTLTLDQALPDFLRFLIGRNASDHTVAAYRTDIKQLVDWLSETSVIDHKVATISKTDLQEYLAYLADLGRSGVTRARKVASIRELFRFLVDRGDIAISPAANLSIPKKERKQQTFLRPDEYSRMLSAAGSNPRDFAILMLFLQTGIRVSELSHLELTDIDLKNQTLRVTCGKGNTERIIPLEKKGISAVKNYLRIRPQSHDTHLFLNYQGIGISRRGVEKLIEKYRDIAGITKQISCHSLRHTFGTYKAERGISAFQLKEWMGHSSIATTQIYVHMSQTNAKREMEETSL
jgi:site-specific recombinase XerD